jgi:thermitase
MAIRSLRDIPVIMVIVLLAIPVLLFSSRYVVRLESTDFIGELDTRFDVETTPFLNYPEPSSEAREIFGDFFIVESYQNIDIKNLTNTPGVLQAWIDEPLYLNPFTHTDSEIICPAPDTHFDFPHIPNDPFFDEQWDKTKVGAHWVWNLTTGEGTTIAILDTGVDSDNEDLVDNLIPGYNFISDTTDTEDDHDHGTHVAGIAAAVIDNEKGIAGLAGHASIMPVKVIGKDGKYYNSDLAAGIIYAADNGAQIINMSMGGDNSSSDLEQAVNYAWNAGVFLCAAAGNDREERSDYPAACEHVMSVAASTPGDSRWSLSNYGETVQIYAPGLDIYSTMRGGYYDYRSGTSMACPQVAGLAALMYSVYPEYSNQELWEQLIQTSDTIPYINRPRINAMKALGVTDIEEVDRDQVIAFPPVLKSVIAFSAHLSSPYKLSIYDVSGSRLISKEGAIAEGEIRILPAELSEGVYFWKLTSSSRTYSGKFVFIR